MKRSELAKQVRRGWWEADVVCWQGWRAAITTGQTSLPWRDWYKHEIEAVRKRMGGGAQRVFRKRQLPEVTGYGRTKLQELINAGEFPPGFALTS